DAILSLNRLAAERFLRRWRRVGPVPPQEPLGGEPVEAQDRVGELAEQGGVGIRLPGFAPQRVLYLGWLERCVAALAREQAQHRHLIVLMRRHPEDRAVRAVGHEPLVHFGRGERYGQPPR